MRNSIWTALLALAVLFALVWLKLRLTGGAPESPPAQAPDAPAAGTRLRVLVDGEVRDMALDDYVVGVTAAEMPADFAPEALKAQAVAARTYALYCARGKKHADADVCTDPGCCQAWLSEDALRGRWGGDFDARHEKIAAAVGATAGEILCYESSSSCRLLSSSFAIRFRITSSNRVSL